MSFITKDWIVKCFLCALSLLQAGTAMLSSLTRKARSREQKWHWSVHWGGCQSGCFLPAQGPLVPLTPKRASDPRQRLLFFTGSSRLSGLAGWVGACQRPAFQLRPTSLQFGAKFVWLPPRFREDRCYNLFFLTFRCHKTNVFSWVVWAW